MKVMITLADVEPAVRLNAKLEAAGVETALVSPMDDVPAWLEREQPDVIVLTSGLTDVANIQLAKRELWDGALVVGLADVSDPALQDRLRALGFVEVYSKPVDIDEVFAGVLRILDRRRLSQETGLIGESEALREVMVKIEQMAPVSSTVLIEGESGTGKELVARAIHRLSPRRSKPFIAVNIGALPDSLLESELFGHEKGAFTGAAERRIGRFELAQGGTLFLDEVGEAPRATQVKLLRVLEQREVMRVGGSQAFKVDVRVVAATNRPLRAQVEAGEFRADLYYRLDVLTIYLPPLRERRADIPLLVRHFVKRFSAQHDREFHGISAGAMQLLVDYSWPGNVRELQNLVESMVVLAPGHEITADDIPREIREGGSARFLPVPVPPLMHSEGGGAGASGRELEFIVRSLVELKLQMEELRQRVELGGVPTGREIVAPGGGERWVGDVSPSVTPSGVAAIEPREREAPANEAAIKPGMTMDEIMRAAIEVALREARGNRRKAARMLGMGERTLYRKLKDYNVTSL